LIAEVSALQGSASGVESHPVLAPRSQNPEKAGSNLDSGKIVHTTKATVVSTIPPVLATTYGGPALAFLSYKVWELNQRKERLGNVIFQWFRLHFLLCIIYPGGVFACLFIRQGSYFYSLKVLMLAHSNQCAGIADKDCSGQRKEGSHIGFRGSRGMVQ
jgi:hypothetical protein